MIVLMSLPQKILPSTVRTSNACQLQGLHTDPIMESTSFNLNGERVALTSCPCFRFPTVFHSVPCFVAEITTHGCSFSPVSNTATLHKIPSQMVWAPASETGDITLTSFVKVWCMQGLLRSYSSSQMLIPRVNYYSASSFQ